jgi:hypothetical protein
MVHQEKLVILLTELFGWLTVKKATGAQENKPNTSLQPNHNINHDHKNPLPL